MEYFIYFTSVKGGNNGDGNCNILVENRINCISDIREIELKIKEKYGFDSLVVSNFIYLSG